MRHIGAPTAERAESGVFMKDYGSITHRKDGYSYGRVSINNQHKTFYVKDLVGDFVLSDKECQNLMNDFALTVLYGNIKAESSIKFYDLTMNYLMTYKYHVVKDDSFDRLERTALHFKKSCIDVELYKLDDSLCQNFLSKIAKKYSKSTLKKDYDLLRAVLSYAYRKKLIECDLAGLLVLPRVDTDTKHIEIYTDDECKRLEDGIRSVLSDPSKKEMRLFRYAPAYILLLNTGLRVSELLALRFSDIKDNSLNIHDTLVYIRDREDTSKHYKTDITSVKTLKSNRSVPLNMVANECILYFREISTSDYIVCNGNGSYLTYSSFLNRFKKICEYLGVPYKGIHALRHTFASRLINCNVSPKIVSDLLGHTSVVFTLNRYVHVNADTCRNAVECLNANLSGKVSVELSGKENTVLTNPVNTVFVDKQPIGESNPLTENDSIKV